jgi:dihydroflavonol-4-reductase
VTTLVTGATGFIGSHVARLLADRGEELRLALEPGRASAHVDDLDAERVRCDVRDRRAVRRALRGVERVYHCAGITSVRPADAARLFEVNVGGTRTVLEECLHADVERVVHLSSAAALGPAPAGGVADERQRFDAGGLGIPYVASVYEAEVEALRLHARGLPVVCANPAMTFGPGDVNLTSTRLVRSFLLGRIAAYAEGAVCVVDVRDVAAGVVTAADAGEPGERYVLGGRNFTFERLFADLGRLSGNEPPLRVPPVVAGVAALLLDASGRGWPMTATEVRAASHWWTYRSTKAARDLRWRARPHEETLEATVEWHLDRERDRIARTRRTSRRARRFQRGVAGAALGVAGGAAGTLGAVTRRLPSAR